MRNKKKKQSTVTTPNPFTINPGDYYPFFSPGLIEKLWIQTGKPAMSYLPIRLYIDTKIREQKGLE